MKILNNLLEMEHETSLQIFEVNVHFALNSEQYGTLFTFLLQQQISFQVVNSPINNWIQREREITVNENRISRNKVKIWKPIIEEIYQKYIVGMLENPMLTQREIAEEFNLTLPNFKKYFTQIYHQPFYQAYLAKKMNYGAELLLQGYKAKVVSEMLGYEAKSSIKFNKMFQKHFGITPRDYQLLNLVKIHSVSKPIP